MTIEISQEEERVEYLRSMAMLRKRARQKLSVVRICPIVLALVVLCGADVAARPIQSTPKVQFSDYILTLDRMLFLGFRDCQNDFADIYVGRSFQILNEQLVEFYDSTGGLDYTLEIDQDITEDRKARRVDFKVTSVQNFIWYRVVIESYGRDLEPLSYTDLRSGQFPTFISQNEDRVDYSYWFYDTEAVNISIRKKDDRGGKTTVAVFKTSEGEVLRYLERQMKEWRYLRYQFGFDIPIEHSSHSSGHSPSHSPSHSREEHGYLPRTYEVKKTSGLIEGREELWVDSKSPNSVKDFLTAFGEYSNQFVGGFSGSCTTTMEQLGNLNPGGGFLR